MAIITGFGDKPGLPEVDAGKCDGCGMCSRACPSFTLSMDGQAVRINRSEDALGCIGCGLCMMICPSGAITVTGRNISSEDLVPIPERAECAGPDQLEALMLGRRSIRKFAQRPVPREMLERIVDMTRTAPMGLPPSDVGLVVLHGRSAVRAMVNELIPMLGKMRKSIGPLMLKLMRPFIGKVAYDQFSSFLLPTADKIIEHHAQGEDWLAYDPPAAIIFHSSPYADPSDAPIACTYAMLAAESLSLGTIMLAFAPAFVERSKVLRARYGIPAGNKVRIMLALGYPSFTFKRTLRRRLASVRWITG